MVRLATRGSISSCKEDAINGKMYRGTSEVPQLPGISVTGWTELLDGSRQIERLRRLAQRVLPCSRSYRALREHKPIRRGQCASSSVLRPASTYTDGCWANGCRNGSLSRSSWRTGRVVAATSARRRSPVRLPMAIAIGYETRRGRPQRKDNQERAAFTALGYVFLREKIGWADASGR
jgi:hypothetical protein